MSATLTAVWIIGLVLAAVLINSTVNTISGAIARVRIAKYSGIDPRSDRETAISANRGNRELGRS